MTASIMILCCPYRFKICVRNVDTESEGERERGRERERREFTVVYEGEKTWKVLQTGTAGPRLAWLCYCRGGKDRLCGLAVRVPGYRSRGPISIPGATRFSEKQWVLNGVHSASWVQLRSYLKERVATSSLENRDYGCWDPLRWLPNTLYP
jgi:hypothetical protein